MLKILCNIEDVQATINYYKNLGFVYSSKHGYTDKVELIFTHSDRAIVAEELAKTSNARAYINFVDGTVSQMYVRRNRQFDD